MQRNERYPEDYDPESPKSRPGSRRNSASLSRRSSVKKDKEGKKKSPLNTAPNSSNSTPKKINKPQNLEFVVTGKQILKKSDRANSLPGYHRRPSAESLAGKAKRSVEPRRDASHSSKSRETSLEDDVSLDLSQVSDFEDTNSKYGIKQKFNAVATSTPKSQPRNFQKPRSASLQSQLQLQRVTCPRRNQKSHDSSKQSRDSTFSCSRDSLYKTSSTASYNRHGLSTELDYSSVSPEYSGQSSAELSPRPTLAHQPSIPSQDMQTSSFSTASCCVSTWADCSDGETKMESARGDTGEWNNFWANYNNSLSKVPMKSYYDQCPTPYRTDNIDLADLDASEDKRSPDNMRNLNYIIRNEGLHLTPRETQNIIKCAHILGNVLTKAIERRSKEKDENEEKIQEIQTDKTEVNPEIESKKKTLTLDLKETNIPLEVNEEKKSETVTTQTDISLPNTKSAPRIFEKILRQLSRTSIEEVISDKKVLNDGKEEDKEAKN